MKGTKKMPKYRKKPVVIEAITFEEFIEYGKNNGGNIVNGFPWSFSYKGHPVTHENDECYLIPTLEGTLRFTPDDVLITGVKGEIYPCKIDIFEATYDIASTVRASNPQIENNFVYHAPKPGQPEIYTEIREKAKELAYLIDEKVPKSREQSLAITNLEQAVFWANAGIARN
jgi:hypothetical protein